MVKELKAQLQQAFVALETEKIESVNTLFTRISEIELDIEMGDYATTTQDLLDLKTLKTEIQQLGQQILEQVLVLEQYDKACKLSYFYSLMAKSPLSDFIAMNKPRLLDFLLSNKILSLKSQDFSLGKERYHSVLDYYFKQHPLTPELIDCLDVLVKNGLSLMELDPISGITYAGLILLQPSTHPLWDILIRNQESTLNNIAFYKKLNSILKTVLAQSDFPHAKKPGIEELIENNQQKIENIMARNAVPASVEARMKQAQSIEAIQAEFVTKYGQEQIDQIQSDPQIQALHKLIEQRSNVLIHKLPKKERAKMTDATQNILDLAKLKMDLTLLPSAEQLREHTIKMLSTALQDLSLKEELLVIQEKLNKRLAQSRFF